SGGIDLLARVEQTADVAVDGEIEGRNALRGRCQALCDGAAHAVVRHDLVGTFLEQRKYLLVRHRRRDRRRCTRCRGWRLQALAGFRTLELAGDAAAVRSRDVD